MSLVRASVHVKDIEDTKSSSSRFHAMNKLYYEEQFTGPGAVFVPLAQVQDGFQRHAIALRDRAQAFSKAGNSEI